MSERDRVRPPAGSTQGQVAACRRYLARLGGLAILLAAAGGLLLALPVGWLLAGPAGWRPGSPVPLLVGIGALLLALGMALGIGRRMVHLLEMRRLVRGIEQAVGLPAGRIRAQLELGGPAGPPSVPGLVAAGEAALRPALARTPRELAGEAAAEAGRLLRRGALLSGGAAALATGLFVASPHRAEVAWAGLVRPLATLHPAPLPPLDVYPGDAVVPRGVPVEVRVVAPGRRGVHLELQAPGMPDRRLELAVEGNEARGTLPPLEGPLSYRAVGDDGTVSPRYHLEPADPLVLSGFSLELVYPPWTGLLPETRTAPPRALQLPEGTRLVFSGVLAAPVERLALVEADPEGPRGAGGSLALAEFTLDPEAGRFEGTWTPRASGEVRWWALGGGADLHALPGSFQVELLPDRPPRVRLEAGGVTAWEGSPGNEGALPWLPPDLRLPVALAAEDDWGLAWVELAVTVFPTAAPVETRQDRTLLSGEREVRLLPELDLRRWALEPGTRIRIEARAADRGAGPGVGVAAPLEFRVPTADQVRQEARAEIARTAERVRTLAGEAVEAGSRDRTRYRDQIAAGAGVSPTPGGADPTPTAGARGAAPAPSAPGGGGAPQTAPEAAREDPSVLAGLREALADEARLLTELDRLQEALSEVRASLGAQSEDRALRRELSALEEALERAAGPGGAEEAVRRLAELEARLETGPPEAGRAAGELGASVARQEELARRLEELRGALASAELRTDIQGAREEAARLAETPELDPARALEARVEALERRLAERAEAGASESQATETRAAEARAGEAVRRAAEALREAREALETAERTGGRRSGGAADSAVDAAVDAATQAAAEAARRAEEALSEAAGADAAAREEAIRAALEAAVHQALALEETLRLEGESGAMAAEGVREGATLLAQALAARLLDLGDGARELAARTGAALQALDGVAERERARAAGLPTSGLLVAREGAERALRELALAALEALDRIDTGGESGQGGDGGEGGEGGGSMGESLGEVASLQEALNQQAAGLDGQPGDARSSGEAQGRMEALSRQQEALADRLSELGREAGGDPRLSELLETLAQEAEATAQGLLEDAAQGRPSGETLARQDRLLERLLDAGRSLERDEPTGERRGTPAPPVGNRPGVPPLPEGLLDRSRILLPSEAALQALSPAERRLVIEYLSRLSRGGGDR